jgi:hypothetical protein
VNGPAIDLGRLLSRVADVDEETVRGELARRFRDAQDVEAGVAAWRTSTRQTDRNERERRDLA